MDMNNSGQIDYTGRKYLIILEFITTFIDKIA